MRIPHFIAFLLCFIFARNLLSKEWRTSKSGSWNEPSAWQGGVAPPYSSSDTFYIHHFIHFEDHLHFKQTARIVIDSTGGLCGFKSFDLSDGATAHQYGVLYCDSIHIYSSQFYAKGPKEVLVRKQILIKYTGAAYLQQGAKTTVGADYACEGEGGFHPLGKLELVDLGLQLYPNPTKDVLYISSGETQAAFSLQIFDLQGKVIFSGTGEAGDIPVAFKPNLHPGIYLYQIVIDKKKAGGKLEVVD